jgi:predicted Ser/Thr protein kinase
VQEPDFKIPVPQKKKKRKNKRAVGLIKWIDIIYKVNLWKVKHNNLARHRKHIWHNSTAVHDIKFEKIRIEEKVSNLLKCIYHHPRTNVIFYGKTFKLVPSLLDIM